jgi:uncharacterized short protein YbdD (DUF466 family)
MKSLAAMSRRLWAAFRALLGDDAYERYLDHQRRRHPDSAPLQRVDFYRTELDRRWSQINRCC